MPSHKPEPSLLLYRASIFAVEVFVFYHLVKFLFHLL